MSTICSASRDLTLGLQLHVCLLHYPEVWVTREHFCPLLHAFQNLRLNLLMGVLDIDYESEMSSMRSDPTYSVIR